MSEAVKYYDDWLVRYKQIPHTGKYNEDTKMFAAFIAGLQFTLDNTPTPATRQPQTADNQAADGRANERRGERGRG